MDDDNPTVWELAVSRVAMLDERGPTIDVGWALRDAELVTWYDVQVPRVAEHMVEAHLSEFTRPALSTVVDEIIADIRYENAMFIERISVSEDEARYRFITWMESGSGFLCHFRFRPVAQSDRDD